MHIKKWTGIRYKWMNFACVFWTPNLPIIGRVLLGY